MNPRGRFNLMMSLLAAAALAFGIWRWRQQAHSAAGLSAQVTAGAEQTRDVNANSTPASTGEVSNVTAASSATGAPLPPWGEPLAANFEALRRRADAGDARAACRVGVELSLCKQSRLTQTQPLEAASPQATTDDGLRAQPGRINSPDRPGQALENYCQGIPSSLWDQAGTYLRKAALAGNRDAMLRYAQGAFSNAPRDGSLQLRALQDPVFADWYREAVPMLHQALHAGDPIAAQLLARAYADDQDLLDALIADDLAKAYGYRLLLSYLGATAAPDPGTLNARQRADAEHSAQRLYRETFASHAIAGGIPPGLTLQPDNPDAAPCQ